MYFPLLSYISYVRIKTFLPIPEPGHSKRTHVAAWNVIQDLSRRIKRCSKQKTFNLIQTEPFYVYLVSKQLT